jgi:polyhydroxybutyrate depolymerase
MSVLDPELTTHPSEPPGTAIERSITVDGLKRKCLVFVPGKPKEPMPVVFVLHGGGGNARGTERYTQFNQAAEKVGFFVIYPDAVGSNWNDGRGVDSVVAPKQNIDDVKFLRLLLEAVARDHRLDRSRVFATGISNGAFMCHRLAAEASDMIAAIAPVVGGMAPAMAAKFKPEYSVSILIIQGEADPLVPIDGGDVGFPRGRKRGKVIPAKETLAKYLERNGSEGTPTMSTLAADPSDGTAVEISKYPDGPGGVKTYYYLVKNGGHAWPGRPAYLRETCIGKASQAFPASEVICQFFASCPPRSKHHP